MRSITAQNKKMNLAVMSFMERELLLTKIEASLTENTPTKSSYLSWKRSPEEQKRIDKTVSLTLEKKVLVKEIKNKQREVQHVVDEVTKGATLIQTAVSKVSAAAELVAKRSAEAQYLVGQLEMVLSMFELNPQLFVQAKFQKHKVHFQGLLLKKMVDTFHLAYPAAELPAAVFDDESAEPDIKTDFVLAAIKEELKAVISLDLEHVLTKFQEEHHGQVQCFAGSLLASGFGAIGKGALVILTQSLNSIVTNKEQLEQVISKPHEVATKLLETIRPDELAEKVAKQLAICALKSLIQPLLKRHQLEWMAMLPVLEEACTLTELKGALRHPLQFLKDSVLEKGRPFAKKLAIMHLKPALGPHLQVLGLDWVDVMPLLEEALENTGTMSELKVLEKDPVAYVKEFVLRKGGPVAKKLVIMHLKPALKAHLHVLGLQRTDALLLLEAALEAVLRTLGTTDELKAALDAEDPLFFLKERVFQEGGPVAKKLMILHLKPVLLVQLQKQGLEAEWADVMPLLEAASTLDELKTAVGGGPDLFITECALQEQGLVAKKLQAIMRVKPALMAHLHEKGLGGVEWADILLVLERPSFTDELKAALNAEDPMESLKERVLQEGGAVAKKLAILHLKPALMMQLHEKGFEVEWVDVMQLLNAGISVDTLLADGASLAKSLHSRRVIHSCSLLRHLEKVGTSLIDSLEERTIAMFRAEAEAVDNTAANPAKRFLCDAVMALGDCQTSLKQFEDTAYRLSVFAKATTDTLSTVVSTAKQALRLTNRRSAPKGWTDLTLDSLIAAIRGTEQRLAREFKVLQDLLLTSIERGATQEAAPFQLDFCPQEIAAEIKKLMDGGKDFVKDALRTANEIKDQAMREVKELASGVVEDVEDAWSDLGNESPIFGLMLNEGISLLRQSYSDKRAKKELWKVRAIAAMSVQRAAQGGGIQCRKSKQQMKAALMLRRALERNASVVNVIGSDDTASQLNLVAVQALKRPKSETEQHAYHVDKQNEALLSGVSEVKSLLKELQKSVELNHNASGKKTAIGDVFTQEQANSVPGSLPVHSSALRLPPVETRAYQEQPVVKLTPNTVPNTVTLHTHQEQPVVKLTPKNILGPSTMVRRTLDARQSITVEVNAFGNITGFVAPAINATICRIEAAGNLDSENSLRKELEVERAKVQVLQQERESVMSRKLDSVINPKQEVENSLRKELEVERALRKELISGLQENIGAAASKLGMLAHAIEHTNISIEDEAAADDRVHWSMVEEETESHIDERMAALEELQDKLLQEADELKQQELRLLCKQEHLGLRQISKNVHSVGQALGIVIKFLGKIDERLQRMEEQLARIEGKLDQMMLDMKRLTGAPVLDVFKELQEKQGALAKKLPDSVHVDIMGIHKGTGKIDRIAKALSRLNLYKYNCRYNR
jgi:hypothetical protein